jgi:hypothetical protein
MTILTTVFNTILVQGPPDVSIGRKLFNRADASELLEEAVVVQCPPASAVSIRADASELLEVQPRGKTMKARI